MVISMFRPLQTCVMSRQGDVIHIQRAEQSKAAVHVKGDGSVKLVKKILSVPENQWFQRSYMYILQLPNCLLDDRCKANPLPPLMRKQETKSQPKKKKPMMKQHTHLFGR